MLRWLLKDYDVVSLFSPCVFRKRFSVWCSQSRILWIHNSDGLHSAWFNSKQGGKKRLTVCLKWHITKTIKGPGPYATRCKHEAMFVIILLGNNDIAGKTSRAWCVAMFSFLLFFEVLVSVPWLQSRNSERAVWGRTAGQHLEAHLMIIKSVTGYLLNGRKRVESCRAFEGTEWFRNVCPCKGF